MPPRKPITAELKKNAITSVDDRAANALQQGFGVKKSHYIVYSFLEACYLHEKARIIITQKDKVLSANELLKAATKQDKDFLLRYVVYKDLRERGYIVKTALKFGADFRVYDKNILPGEDHAKWLVRPVFEREKLSWQQFAAENRVAHSTRKFLLIALVDEEQDITYFQSQWIRP